MKWQFVEEAARVVLRVAWQGALAIALALAALVVLLHGVSAVALAPSDWW